MEEVTGHPTQNIPFLVAELKRRVVSLKRRDFVTAFLRSSTYPEHSLPNDVEALAGSSPLWACSEDALDSLGTAWCDIENGGRLAVYGKDKDCRLVVAYFSAAYMFLVLRGSSWWMHAMAGVDLIAPLRDYCTEAGLDSMFYQFVAWWCDRASSTNTVDLDIPEIERELGIRPERRDRPSSTRPGS
jgi:hypothetical protein